ncbi:MAG: LysM peptidoglycan-binding domain-containing M23 family metallopeptidase [Pseudorhodobacter sp.]|nr:LysM peptidoglycan-binding domain-containing M23 family metallopeptidase [Pseudorhodobacter sp.]
MFKGNTGVRVTGVLAFLLLSACGDGATMDWDLRNNDSTTAGVANRATANRPAPDQNGVISYPNYQVVVAKRGDTVAGLATRIGISGTQLAGFNALKPDDTLRAGEVLALPVRVAGATQPTATAPGFDVTSIAASALDRVDTQALPTPASQSAPIAQPSSGAVPVRYQVKRGETAFTIARSFGISAKALADWNGLGSDLAVREGQYLIIPTAQDAARMTASGDATPPGQGSPLPEPPSASLPLPDEPTQTAAQVAATLPASPDLGAQRTASSAAQFAMPVDGKIVRGYQKKVNDGIDISASPGAPVKAAAAGVVAAVTHDPSGDLIVVIKHSGGLLTVYTGIDNPAVAQGDAVTRGQIIAKATATGQVHFEVRQGLNSVDPVPYL